MRQFNMCYAIPAKIMELGGDTAVVDYGGVEKKVNISLVSDPKVGGYILIHAGFAIMKLLKKSAEESLALIRKSMVEQSIDNHPR